MTYQSILSFAATIQSGDRASAQRFITEIVCVLDASPEDLTDDQRRYLYKLRKKWEARADGTDARWIQFGSKPGRTRTQDRSRGRATIRNEAEHDPLLARIIQKFGKPLPREDV